MASVRLARTMRWAMVGSGTRNARAISLGGEPAEQAQRERDARLGGQHRVAGGEDQPQEVVADVVVHGGVEVRRERRPPGLQVAGELLVLALQPRAAAQLVDGAVLGRGHQPGARVARDAFRGPLLERRDQRVVRQVLGQSKVAHHARQAGDEPAATPVATRPRWRVAPRASSRPDHIIGTCRVASGRPA